MPNSEKLSGVFVAQQEEQHDQSVTERLPKPRMDCRSRSICQTIDVTPTRLCRPVNSTKKISRTCYNIERVPMLCRARASCTRMDRNSDLSCENSCSRHVYSSVRKHCEKELIELTMTVIEINNWNRLSIIMRRLVST